MDARRTSQACARNSEPIAHVLDAVLPKEGTVLEIGSGTGEHALFFSKRFPGLVWQPTDQDIESLASIKAWKQAEGPDNMRAPTVLDATADDWQVGEVDVVFSANVIHISPLPVTMGVIEGAARVLRSGGLLVFYGPFKVNGQHTAHSNEQFEQWLKARDPSYGVRDLEMVRDEAAARGLVLEHTIDMPANNKTLVFRKQ